MTDETGAALDLNAAFRGGGRSIEWLDQINQASIVMLAETGIVRAEVAGRIARGIARLMDEEQSNASRRRSSADYLDYEPRLTTLVGADASRLHSGRSRQDLASTIARMNLRDGLLQVLSALLRLRERVHARASEHIDTIIPAYTHGVQAQPTTFAHYLHALSEALARECERIMQVHARVNRNPLGAAVLATSSFPIDRARLSALLGFEGLVENAYDANHLAPVDSALEVAGSYAIAALQIGQFAQDVHAQYADPVPWMLLATGELTGTSSIMPQKRNPAALEQLRAQASMWLGEMQSQPLLAHNNRTGMFDYRLYDPVPHARAVQVLDLARRIVDGLVVDAERALNMVLADYSTTTEIADVLAQVADVPFRIGHHFASKLTDHGRSKGLRLHEIPYETVARLYQTESGQALPLDEAALRRVTSAEHMVQGRRGQGGPQRVEMQRMLDAERTRIDACDEWLRRSRADLAAADATREQAFRALCDGD
ncbi:MAG: argininosuccinate lyase [Gammaproteobacteria bacterium]|nr:argininosuccinate lyase [Gammaproteobacteria bacterium]